MSDQNDTIGREVFPMPVLIYGEAGCEDTQFVREHLNALGVSFVEVDIEGDEAAARFVERVNHGMRVTPTIVFGKESFIIVEPSLQELNQALRRAGYDA